MHHSATTMAPYVVTLKNLRKSTNVLEEAELTSQCHGTAGQKSFVTALIFESTQTFLADCT